MSLSQFLSQNSRWDFVEPVAGDASSRVFSRIYNGMYTAILMEVNGEESIGHSLSDFVKIQKWLSEQGITVPEIYEQYDQALIVEDFGSLSLKQAVQYDNQKSFDLYSQAADILAKLRGRMCPLDVPSYFESHVHQGLSRFVEFYVPAILGRPANDEMRMSFQQIWKDIMQSLPRVSSGFVHIDFHAENLMFLPDGKIGVIDFQGGMNGPQAYDLANLLYDARTDMPEEVRLKLLLQHDPDMQLWVHVMAAQFHCRVIGQFIKLALFGKEGYLIHMPRLAGYLNTAIKSPVLEPLTRWCGGYGITFDAQKSFEIEEIEKFIAKEAV